MFWEHTSIPTDMYSEDTMIRGDCPIVNLKVYWNIEKENP